ncbi:MULTISPECIES: class I SAM-dependent methyltransferase [Streptomyces]|uniref:Class I SAM-dependent methyltransferase n=1 Tax=Streptomyces fimbriatus TaxID=68197 RepID=A0ABW0D3A0_STRFI|nr:class I SAM-dependent methyltransferase [Streptomyces sp.]
MSSAIGNPYDDLLADVYDLMYPDALSGTAEAVEFVAGLCPPTGSVLEFGVGNGRLAVPLSARGLEVFGIDSSSRMLGDLAERDPDGKVKAVEGDFLTASTGRRHEVVLMALNTFFSLPQQEQQIDCLRRMREHLAPGGRVVLEAFDPSPYHRQEGERTTTRFLGPGTVMLESSHVVPSQQLIILVFALLADGPTRTAHTALRYAWPAEIDAMARCAGLRLVERHAGWEREPYGPGSQRHVSVYEAADAAR